MLYRPVDLHRRRLWLRAVVKNIEVRGHNGVTTEVNHWNISLGSWSTLRWNASMTNVYVYAGRVAYGAQGSQV